MRATIPGMGSTIMDIDTELLEGGASPTGKDELVRRGYEVAVAPAGDHPSRHARMVRVTDEGLLGLAADPRSSGGACVGR